MLKHIKMSMLAILYVIAYNDVKFFCKIFLYILRVGAYPKQPPSLG